MLSVSFSYTWWECRTLGVISSLFFPWHYLSESHLPTLTLLTSRDAPLPNFCMYLHLEFGHRFHITLIFPFPNLGTFVSVVLLSWGSFVDLKKKMKGGNRFLCRYITKYEINLWDNQIFEFSCMSRVLKLFSGLWLHCHNLQPERVVSMCCL